MHSRTSSILAAAAIAFASHAFGAAQVFDKEGDVQRFVAGATPTVVGGSERIAIGNTVTTGPGGKVILRMDDGLQVAMNENSAVKLVAYKYRDAAGAAGEDVMTLELVRGAVRIVTGAMAERSPQAFTLRGPQAALTIRGPTDFSVVLVNPMFLAVNQGTVVMANQAGKLALAEGSTVQIANANAIATSVQAGTLPQAAAGPLQNLQLASVTTPGAAAAGAVPGTTVATTGTAFGIGTPGIVAIGAGAAAVAGAASDDDEPSGSSTTHH